METVPGLCSVHTVALLGDIGVKVVGETPALLTQRSLGESLSWKSIRAKAQRLPKPLKAHVSSESVEQICHPWHDCLV